MDEITFLQLQADVHAEAARKANLGSSNGAMVATYLLVCLRDAYRARLADFDYAKSPNREHHIARTQILLPAP